MFKRTQVVMLPTDQKALKGSLALSKNGELLMLKENEAETINKIKQEHWKLQNLYFLSDHKINEGDWIYNSTHNSVIKAGNNTLVNLKTIDGHLCKKIIATTDIGKAPTYFPQPSQAFIQKFVEEYNKNNQLTEILVEYKEDVISLGEANPNDTQQTLILKVDKDNTITIKKLKDSWNREEVLNLVTLAFNAGHERGFSGYPKTENWSKETLEGFIKKNL